MTKDEIVTHLSDQTGTTKQTAEKVYGSLVDLIAVELRAGREFQIRDIGTLKVKQSEARSGRNPATGAAIQIPARKSVKIKVSQTLSNALNA